jgi:predicted DNA-binding transcriptional regulator AlpA
MNDDNNRQGNAPNSGANRVSGVAGVSAKGSAVEPALWRVADVARFLTMSPQWVYKQAELGALPCLRLGASLRFHPNEVRAWLDRQRATPGRVVPLRSSMRVDE